MIKKFGIQISWPVSAAICVTWLLMAGMVMVERRHATRLASMIEVNAKTSAALNQEMRADILKSIAPLAEQQKETDAAVSDLLDLAQSTKMPQLELAKWQGRNIKVIDYTLDADVDLQFLAGTGLPRSWAPVAEGALAMPYEWPELPVNSLPKQLVPETIFYNLVGLANRIKAGDSSADELTPYADMALAKINEVIARPNGRALISYNFPLEWLDLTFQPGWVSSFGNASVLAASVYYYKQTRDQRFLQIARDLVDGFRAIDGADRKWVSHIDGAQFLWFEEYPIDGPKKAHVINGHIWATFALADYCRLTQDDEACVMTRAGLATVRRYIASYRKPGRANRYSYYSKSAIDYGPTRTIQQQHALFLLTKDPFFKEMANTFAGDMPLNPR